MADGGLFQGPGAGGWWARQVVAATVMSLVGEYFCMKYELREISVVALAGTGMLLNSSFLILQW